MTEYEENFEERAAIRQFDAGIDIQDAERLARDDIARQQEQLSKIQKLELLSDLKIQRDRLGAEMRTVKNLAAKDALFASWQKMNNRIIVLRKEI